MRPRALRCLHFLGELRSEELDSPHSEGYPSPADGPMKTISPHWEAGRDGPQPEMG